MTTLLALGILDSLRDLSGYVSTLAIPLMIVGVPVYGLFKRVPVYEAFIDGAKEGFDIAVLIIPYLIAILMAIGVFRASGAMDAIAGIIGPAMLSVGISPELLPMMIARPLTGGGSLGILSELNTRFGSDSLITQTAAVMYGSTETTFYVIAVYFGAVGIKKVRHSLLTGLIADFTAMILAVYVVLLLMGHS